MANTEPPVLWCRVGSHGTRNLTKGSNYKIFKKVREVAAGWVGGHQVDAGPGASASVCGPGTRLVPWPNPSFSGKKQLKQI